MNPTAVDGAILSNWSITYGSKVSSYSFRFEMEGVALSSIGQFVRRK